MTSSSSGKLFFSLFTFKFFLQFIFPFSSLAYILSEMGVSEGLEYIPVCSPDCESVEVASGLAGELLTPFTVRLDPEYVNSFRFR